MTVKRNNSLDLLRIISTFAVIIIHVNSYIASMYNWSIVSMNYYSFFNVVTRFSVPCFVMISGAMTLKNKNNINVKSFYKKTFYKIGIPFIVFSIVIIVGAEVSAIINNNGLFEPILSLLKGDYNNYWFMFMLFGLYFLTPYIIRIKILLSNKHWIILSCMWLFLSCITSLSTKTEVSYSFSVIFSYLGYYLIGNVIYENLNKLKSWVTGLVFVFSFLLFVLVFFIRGKTGFADYAVDPYKSFFSPLIIIASVLIFLGFVNIEIKNNLVFVSSTTYLIYLFHTKVYILLITFISKMFAYLSLDSLTFVLLISITTFGVSMVLSIVYDKLWCFIEKRFSIKEKFLEK